MMLDKPQNNTNMFLFRSALILLVGNNIILSNAFVQQMSFRQRSGNNAFVIAAGRGSTRLSMAPYDEDESLEIFAARERLEALMKDEYETPILQSPHPVVDASAVTDHSHHHYNDNDEEEISSFFEGTTLPLSSLTSHRSEIRNTELGLLSKLQDGDEAIGDLWALWRSECGIDAEHRLSQADKLIGEGPRKWREAETVLLNLVEEHGADFTEAMNRLASLCYLQGKHEEAEGFCKMVLKERPWHFGALSTIVMIYAAMTPDSSDRACQWAARRLPTYKPGGTNRRRKQWVENAVRNALRSLLDAEFTIDHPTSPPPSFDELDPQPFSDDVAIGEEDAWQ